MANSYIFNLTDSRWTNPNVVYDGFKLTITTTGSDANSNLLRFVIDSKENFKVRKDGSVFANGNLTISGNITSNTITSKIVLSNTASPINSSANGLVGELRWDSNYLYVCVATNTWKRFALSSW